MSNIQKVFQEAIRKKQAIKIFLTNQTDWEGYIPVHVVFWNPELKTELKETTHHKNFDEVEINVDNEDKPYIAWSVDNPNTEVMRVHFYYEGIDREDSPVYAFLDIETEPAYEMGKIREELVDYLKNIANEEALAEEIAEDDDFFYSVIYKIR